MNTPKNMIFLIILLCGGALLTGCGKENDTATVKTSTLSVIRTEEDTGEKEKTGELTEFDAFEGIYPNFSGTSPNGTASVVYRNKANPMRYFYSVEPHSDLRNGDVVKISIDGDDPEKKANEYGYTLLETEKEFVVEGLDYYVETIDEITDELQQKMQDRVISNINAELNRRSSNAMLKDCELIGYYLLSKVTDSYDLNNHCYGVYWITIIKSEQEMSYYYCERCDNIIIKNGGGCKITTGHSDMISKTKGCQTLDEIYEECVEDWCWDTENVSVKSLTLDN